MRRLKTSALLLIAVGFMASCSYKTCPAYTQYPTQAQDLQASTQSTTTGAVSTGAVSTEAPISVGR